MIWKISTNKEQITPVTKRSMLSSGGTSIQLLCSGVSNQTKAIFFVHSLTKNNYPRIFQRTEPYHFENDGVRCKNAVQFVEYENDIEVTGMQLENESTENVILKRASPLLNDLMDEQYLFVFLKLYGCTQGNPVLRIIDYFLMKVKSLCHWITF